MRHVKRVMITMPNTSWLGKRLWVVPPYTLGILSAVVDQERYEVEALDPHLGNLSIDQTVDRIMDFAPEVVALTCMSLEYAQSFHALAQAIKERAPKVILLLGGVYVTTSVDLAMRDKVADYGVMGEGEERFPQILDMLDRGETDFSKFDGIAYWQDDKLVVNDPVAYVKPLDTVPFPDYQKMRLPEYFNVNNSFGNVMNARYEPYVLTSTSRGCPYDCIYCSTHSIDGSKVRLRSAENVLEEIDILYNDYGVKEILFLDDNLIINRKRFKQILQGLIDRDYDLWWKSLNLATFLLTEDMLEMMKEAKTYQLILPIESGNQHVLDHILKKPLDLRKVPPLVKKGKELGFEISADFIIGSPGETWDQIRDTCNYADEMDVDMVSFHIATPLPKTEMYSRALELGALPQNFDFGDSNFFGFGRGSIATDEFQPQDLHMLRALEWDRINFKTQERRERFAKMSGISLEELAKWRKNTIRNLGLYFPNAEGKDYTEGDGKNDTPKNGLLDKNGRFMKVVNA
ncbi:B12-binding domain-containing radical SAM protein [Magnetococcus sp. PR-3]|uniref:B12-binding domain-containing radical SAM protein n=1 Tax=Magnetococcus sp. PR-3 TaxID=3120355 RepID=UPI002FCE0A17